MQLGTDDRCNVPLLARMYAVNTTGACSSAESVRCGDRANDDAESARRKRRIVMRLVRVQASEWTIITSQTKDGDRRRACCLATG